MSRRLLGLVALVAVLVAGTTVYAQIRPGGSTYTVTADVAQAPNLFANARVMVRGVEVGKVTGVDPRPSAVRLTMEIESGVKVPSDARLIVVPITVISDRYVQLAPAYVSGSVMRDGSHIPTERTAIPAELDDTLAQLKKLLETLEPAPGERRGPLARLIGALDDVVRGRSSQIRGTLASSASVLDNLAGSESDITRLIRNLDRLFASLATRTGDITLLNQRLQLVFEALVGDREHIEGTIENLAFLATEATGLVSESGDELGESFGRLADVVDDLLASQDALLETVRWTNVIAESLGVTNASGRGLFAYTGKQARPGTARAKYNYRIETRDTIACNRIDALIQSFLALNPDATLQELRDTLLTFIPDAYDDDLAFLIDQLIPLCATLPEDAPPLSPAASKLIDDLAGRIGVKEVRALLLNWFLEHDSYGAGRPRG